jgi:hypothetical protein
MSDRREIALQQWRRSKKRRELGGPCLLLHVDAIQRIVPCLDGEMVKKFLLAASHVNELGVGWPGVRQFMAYRYTAESHKPDMKALEEVGLIRYIRENAKDPVTRRQLSDAYQINPEVVYIRRAKRAEALALSDKPFMPLPSLEEPDRKMSEPDRSFLSDSDQNQESTNTKNQRQLNQRQLTNNQATNNFSPQGENNSTDGKHTTAHKRKNKKTSRSGASARRGTTSGKAATARSATSGSPSPGSGAPPPKIDLSPFKDPLPDSLHEATACEMVTRTAGAMSHPWARYLTKQYGTAAIRAALQVLAAQPSGTVQKPAGYVRRLLERGAIDPTADAQQHSTQPDAWRVSGNLNDYIIR